MLPTTAISLNDYLKNSGGYEPDAVTPQSHFNLPDRNITFDFSEIKQLVD